MRDDFYRRDIRLAIKSMTGLTLEERGAYNTLKDHQYLMGGPLPDDDAYLAGLMGCDVRIWRRVKGQLLIKKRISISDGVIADERASYTLASRELQRSQRVASGQLGGIASGLARKSQHETPKINDLGEPHASPASNQIRGEKRREDNKENNNRASPLFELAKVLDGERAKAVVDHRQKLKKPLTAHAAKLLAAKFAACPDPNAAADTMIGNGWQGFDPKWLDESVTAKTKAYDVNNDPVYKGLL